MPRQTKPDAPALQLVPRKTWPLDLPPEQKALVMNERKLTVSAFRQLGAWIEYCTPRGMKPPEGGEEFHKTDGDLRDWIDDVDQQGLNGAITLHQGVVEARIFGPDDSLATCFFAACLKLGVQVRYAIARHSQATASSVLFKLRDDEAARLHDEYSGFKPKAFAIDDTRRGVMLNYAPPVKKGSTAHKVTTLVPGSLLWHDNGADYDLLVWRDESGQKPSLGSATGPQIVDFFRIVRAAGFAAILNLLPGKAWEDYSVRRSVCEWLARVVLAGQAVNSNIVFAKASRAIISEPSHAESLIELICEAKNLAAQREECLVMFKLARTRLDGDPNRLDVAGWSIIRERFGEPTRKALHGILTVGADSSLLEQFAERYLLCNGDFFIDRKAFGEGRDEFKFTRDQLTLTHAPDQILTLKKPIEAFPLFIKSKMRQDVTGMELRPDNEPGVVLRIDRRGAVIPDDDYAPEHSRLIFNSWAGLYVPPAKTIEAALKAECEDKLNHMLSLVAKTPERAAWIKANFGWTLKHPGRKQQVALVCTGDQSTGKTFLCQDFAGAIFGRYAGKGSMLALEGPFYIPSYVDKLWVNHDEVVTEPKTIELVKDLIRATRISGQFKNQNVAVHTTYARLSFTSNETNPGLSRGADRGLFQVTSITAVGEKMLPTVFRDHMNKTSKPFYASFYEFLKREDVCQAYVKLLIDCAPDTIAEVEDLTHSAIGDADVAAKHMGPEQLVAKRILESGTIWGGWDIAMPFAPGQLQPRVTKVAHEIGVRGGVSAEAVIEAFIESGILDSPLEGVPFLFKFKIGTLQREFGKFIGATLRSFWPLEPNDYMPNDYRTGDSFEPWKGRGK